MAKIDNGQEQLYAYTTAGNKASFIYDKTTPVEERIVNVNFVIGNAQNLEVIINSSVIYATIEDLEEALDAHDAGADAHEPAFDAHNAADDAHKDFTGARAEALVNVAWFRHRQQATRTKRCLAMQPISR